MIDSDARLFVLDEQGLFFSESRQELHTFNTPATFIWCCLEENLDPAEIAAAYERTFAVSGVEAEAHVAGMLSQWQGLGYISGFDPSRAPRIELTTALGRLLSTPALRVAFAASPAETARALALRADHVAAFVALDPESLERQSEMLRARHSELRLGSPPTGSDTVFVSVLSSGRSALEVATESRLLKFSAPSLACHYRLLDTVFRVRFASLVQGDAVQPALAHLAVEETKRPDVVLELLEAGEDHLILEDIVPVEHCSGLDRLAPLVKGTVRRLAVNRHRHFLQLHAGVVSNGERCLILPGAPGSGKTTLTAALSAAGFQYFSDEFALLEENTLELRPVPLSLTVKPGAIDVLTAYYPELSGLPAHLREDMQIVRYLRPRGALPDPDRSCPVGWIVFPRYAPGAATALRALGKADTLHRLMRECLAVPEPLDGSRVQSLVNWIRQVNCFELSVRSLAEAVDVLRDLCGISP